MFSKQVGTFFLLIMLAGLAAGCRNGGANPVDNLPTPAPDQITLTSIPFTAVPTAEPTPTATPEPLALRVNGDGVTLAEYQADLALLQEAHQALGKTVSPEDQRLQVLEDFTGTLLLAQGAAENGFSLDDAGLQALVDRLAQQLGGEQALQDWMTSRGYSPDAFRAALRRQAAAAWQRDQIAAAVPQAAEQVHARQILAIDETIARRALEQVNIPGSNFAVYAYRYDLQTGGDLGWFPRGYLTQTVVEDAAFAMQPGEISALIESEVGYHILQVIAREPSRPISSDARRVLQHNALQDWLAERRAASQIQILLP